MSASRPLHEWTASEIVRAVDAGKVNCEEVARACLERIEAREPQVLAWQYLNPDRVLEQARALDRSPKRGPLQGVPFGIKDIIDTYDMPTEYGSPIYKGHQPRNDAACVALGRRAGGILMGKTVTTEFANVFPGKTRNPFDPTRTPGGSSSGSAAAVGDCMVPLAIGTQTTGSTIRPAAFCGTVGYRPTHGDLRVAGVKEAAGSLDTIGLIARSVEDIARYREVLLGADPQPVAAFPRAPKIGLCRTHLWSTLEPYTQELVEGAARTLEKAGATIVDVTLPKEFEDVESVHRAVSSFEFARNFTWEIDHHWDLISEKLRNGRLKHGLACTYEAYVTARNAAEHMRVLLPQSFGDCDILLTASALGEAPIGIESTGNAAPSAIWTITHGPQMTLPVFKGPNGLPVGVQVVARRNEDRKLFSAAQWVYDRLTA
jgi:amidase